MIDHSKHLIPETATIREALERLNSLPQSLTLFVVDKNNKLTGALTDGDIRRALINGTELSEQVNKVMFRSFRYLKRGNFSISEIDKFRTDNIYLIPVVDDENKILKIINLKNKRSVLPIDVVIMAGGRGERLRPLTDETPKPLLKVGDKSILERNIERLTSYGTDNIFITVKYLGEKIEKAIGDGKSKGINIRYVYEKEPMGTIGSVSLITEFLNEIILVMNSDLLTNIDFEDFFKYFINEKADMAVASIPYQVDIPYAVLEREASRITSFKEKPTYTYYSNGGIYLIKKDLLSNIPVDKSFNATDFMQTLINKGNNVVNYPILGYWLDIGRHEDYIKACNDIKHIQF